MINIVSYKVPKQGSVIVGSGGYASSTSVPSGTGTGTLETHTLWGQQFDGTNDVSGDLTGVGSITASGDITTDGCVKSPCYSGGNATFSALTAATAALSALTATGITASGITGNTAHINNKLTTNQLEAISGFIGTLLSTNLTVDNLTVTRAAHFFKLIIDEIKSVGGQLILTPANATFDKVEAITGGWRCYWKSKDSASGKEISNQFEVNDQVVCQTFNAAAGTSYNVSNTYYWRLVTATGRTTTTIDGTEYECNYIDLSSSDKDSASISDPAAGDSVAQLGNRTDNTRQAAIILSAYNSQFLDAGLVAPSIVQYAGINNYNLSTHRLNVLSNGLNQFKGSYTDTNGNDLSTMITTTTGTVATLSGDVGTLSGTVTSHTQSISNLVQTDQAISGVVSSNTQSIGTLTNNVNTLSGTVTSHTQSISNLVQTSNAISASVSSNTQSITSVSGTVNGLTSDVSNLSATVTSHTQSIAALGLTDQAISGVVSSNTQNISTVSGNVNTVSGNVNALSGSVTSVTQDVANLKVQASGISSTVESLEKSLTNAWAMPLQGWQNYVYSQTSESVVYNSDRTAVRDVDGDLCSPVVFVQSGQTATFEVWLNGNNNMWWYWCWGDQVELSAGAYYIQNRQRMGLSEQAETDSGGRHRYIATFTPSSDVYMTINYTNDHWLYNPRLVMSTGIATKSEVNQSANSLGMFLYDGLYETGIAIKNKTIKLRGDKVTFSNSAGNVSGKIWIDSTSGTLHAVDGDFQGKVTAKAYFSTPKNLPSAQDYTIDLANDPYTFYLSNQAFAHAILPDPSDWFGVELQFYFIPGTRANLGYLNLSTFDGSSEILCISGSGTSMTYGFKSSVYVQQFSLVTLKSMNGFWYLLTGTVTETQ